MKNIKNNENYLQYIYAPILGGSLAIAFNRLYYPSWDLSFIVSSFFTGFITVMLANLGVNIIFKSKHNSSKGVKI